MKKWWWVLGLAGGLALMLVSRKNGANQPLVHTVKVARGTVAASVKAQGLVEVVESAKTTVRARTPALIQELYAAEGEKITRGKPLLAFDRVEAEHKARQCEERVRSASADWRHAEQEWERVSTLTEKQVESLQQRDLAQLKRDQAKAALGQAEAELALAKNLLEKLTCPAPHDGTVVAKFVEAGQHVAPGQDLFLVADLDQLEIHCKVDEVDAASVAPGQKAEITSAALPGRTFTGRVSEIAPRVVQEKEFAAVTVKVRVLDRNTSLKMGSQVDVRFITRERHGVLAVPTACLKTSGAKTSVFVVDRGAITETPVTLGLNGIHEAEIAGGLAEGQTIVVNPPAGLSTGGRVRTP